MKFLKKLIFAVDNSKDTVLVSLDTSQKINQIMKAKQADLMQGVINGLHEDLEYTQTRELLIWTIMRAIMNGQVVIA